MLGNKKKQGRVARPCSSYRDQFTGKTFASHSRECLVSCYGLDASHGGNHLCQLGDHVGPGEDPDDRCECRGYQLAPLFDRPATPPARPPHAYLDSIREYLPGGRSDHFAHLFVPSECLGCLL